jgi:sugar lactone lactonase YvrE
VASDPQGKRIALATQGDNGGAFLLTDVQSFAPVLPLANPSALAFSEDGASLYVLDGNSLQLDVAALSDGSFQTMSLDGLQDPIAIASGRDSQNRQIVYVASRSDQDFRAYDRATQQLLTDLALDFKPTGIVALGRNSFVIFTRSKTQSPLWLFTTEPQPAVYFVPAPQPAPGGSE